MPTRLIYAFSLAMAGSSTWAVAGDFEGVIHMKSTFSGTETKSAESDWFVKGDHVRMEMKRGSGPEQNESSVPNMTMIFNADKKTTYMLMPGRNVYTEHSAEQDGEKISERFKDSKYEIVRTGKTDTVAGYRCDIFLTKDKETGKIRGESCATKGLANMGALMGLSRSDAGRLSADVPRELRQFAKDGYFLMRMVTKDENDAERVRMEATGVEKKRLDSSLFLPPPGSTKFDMGAVLQRRKELQQSGKENQGQTSADLQQMIQERKKRKAEGGGSSASDPKGESMQEMLKNIQEMMKKQRQSGQ
ncbi:MAG TPA: DUF4412 domain-containing protein [Nitrospira sp.]|nr:DUF4412 domain-containing protein [Nitrospira sp.]